MILPPVEPSPLLLPPGYGFRKATLAELKEREDLLNLCQVWEPPRRRGARKYIVAADIGDGLEQDYSVAEVIRVGTIEEPAEQVAEFASNTLQPMDFAPILLALGQWYTDQDGIEACVAIETNNHGLSTQDTLQLHFKYTQFYIWEYYDSRDEHARYSTKIGWMTTPRTRPMLLDKFYRSLTTLDPITGLPDLVTHSPALHEELKDFQTDGALWEAEAARGAHDDHIMATAIGNYVAWRLQAGETEPLEDRRRRRNEQRLHNAQAAARAPSLRGGVPDWRNTPATADEHAAWIADGEGDVDDPVFVDPDARLFQNW